LFNMGSFLSKAKTTTSTTAEKMSGPTAFKHYSKAQTTFKPPLIAHDNHFLGDVYSRFVLKPGVNPTLHASPRELTDALVHWFYSDHLDPEKPISCGFYRLEAGTPLVYTYTYHEMKFIVDGEFDISDETGQEVHAVAGDVFFFPKGSVITFKTKTFGLGFYCGQRKEGTA
jgi:uncharacterized cupin superfamily protein